jgi:hypothetical protein
MQQRRQRSIYMAGGSALAVVLVVAVIVAVSLTGNGKGKSNVGLKHSTDSFALTSAITNAVTGVPVSRMVAAAEACYRSSACIDNPTTGVAPPQKLAAGSQALTSGGRPEILYIGAEYCPFCAGERWPMTMALSKFGTFDGLRGVTSSATDVNPSTPTFSYYGSSYHSKYLSFVPVEEETNTQGPLQNPTSAQQAIVTKYDAPPYVPASQYSPGAGPIPFVYLAGKYIVTGIEYDASALSEMQMDGAATYMTGGGNPTSQHALAAAGFLVGDICALTHGQPAGVCSQVPANLKGITTSSPVSAGSSSAGATTPTTSKGPTGTAKKKG